MDQIVHQVLVTDHAHRELNSLGENDLFTLIDLKPNEWDYSLPTLASGNSNNKLVSSQEEFTTEFYRQIPFKIRMDHVLIAGGSVSSILIKSNPHDIDLFIYDLTPAAATQRVNELINDLSTAYDQYLTEKEKEKNTGKRGPPEHCSFKFIRNKNCLTLIFDDKYTFQIILRIYQNISQILHGFDLGSSAVGFDGNNVYFTSLSKFAYEYSCNILDTTRRSTTYEHRLVKYYNRAFDIILPHLDVSKIRNTNSKYRMDDVCELPYLVFSYSTVMGNKISVSRFLGSSDTSGSDYQIEDLDEHKIFYINLHNLVWNKPDFYFYREDVKDKDKDNVLSTKPLFSRRRVINYYDELITKLSKNGSVNIKMLKKYVKDTSAILRILIEKGDTDSQFTTVLSQTVQGEKMRILAITDQLLAQSYPLQWMITNPGTQITSSFNPIIEDQSKWYGDYYLETPKTCPLPTIPKDDGFPSDTSDESPVIIDKVISKMMDFHQMIRHQMISVRSVFDKIECMHHWIPNQLIR